MEIILFNSVRTVILAEKHLKRNGLFCNIRPVPTNITSECGMCIEIRVEEQEKIMQILAAEHFEFTIHHLT